MLSLAVTRREHARTVRLRRSQTARNCAANASTAARDELQQLADDGVARRVGGRRAALLDLAQPVVQRLDQQPAPARVVEQVVLQVGVALHHPDVAQHLVQHARRAAGAALAAQQAQHLPGARARAGGSRSRGRRTRCSCRESRAAAARPRRRRRRHRRCGSSGSGAFMARAVAADRQEARGIVPQRSKTGAVGARSPPRSRRVFPLARRGTRRAINAAVTPGRDNPPPMRILRPQFTESS